MEVCGTGEAQTTMFRAVSLEIFLFFFFKSNHLKNEKKMKMQLFYKDFKKLI